MKNWGELFERRILFRGEEYYRRGSTGPINRNKDGSIRSVVHGTNDYHVHIVMEDGEPVQMHCSCPYAADGNRCKHMAAVLFALERDPYIDPVDIEEQDTDEILNSLSVDELRGFVRDQLRKIPAVQDEFLQKYSNGTSIASMKMYVDQLTDCIFRYTDYNGCIPEEAAEDFTKEYTEIFMEAAEHLLDTDHAKHAALLAASAYKAIMPLETDEEMPLGLLASELLQQYRSILPLLKKEEKKLFRRRLEQITDLPYGREYVYKLLHFIDMDMITEADEMKGRLQEFDDILVPLKGPDSPVLYEYDYEEVFLCDRYTELMCALQYDEEDIDSWLWKNRRFYVVRLKIAKRTMDQGDFKKAEYVLMEGKARDHEYKAIMELYQQMLVEVYTRAEDSRNLVSAFSDYVRKYGLYPDMYRSLRSVLSPEDKQILLQMLSKAHVLPSDLCILLHEEKMYAELLETILKYKEISLLHRYFDVLSEYDPSTVISIVTNDVRKNVRSTSSREGYRYLVSDLLRLWDLPGGKEEVIAIAEEWKVQYRRRPAMIDELSRIYDRLK